MTLPKQHLPGETHRSIRCTIEGTYYLAPNPQCVQTLRYTYGRAVEMSGVIPHCEMTMSNHRQGLVTDPRGSRAEFHKEHHGVFAQRYNKLLMRSGAQWDDRRTSEAVVLDGKRREDTRFEHFEFPKFEKEEHKVEHLSIWITRNLSDFERCVVYDLTNPQVANLIETVNSYPGFHLGPQHWGKWVVVRRPGYFPHGYAEYVAFMALPPVDWWDNVDVVDTGDGRTVVAPATLDAFEERRELAKARKKGGLDPDAYELFISTENLLAAKAHYNALITTVENHFTAKRQKAGKRVFGRRSLIRQDPFYRPPRRKRKRHITLRFIGSKEDVEAARKAYDRFRRNYRRALKAFAAGRDFQVVFPVGIQRMVQVANVRCRAAPLPSENPMR